DVVAGELEPLEPANVEEQVLAREPEVLLHEPRALGRELRPREHGLVLAQPDGLDLLALEHPHRLAAWGVLLVAAADLDLLAVAEDPQVQRGRERDLAGDE